MKVRAVLILLSVAVATVYSCNQSSLTREILNSSDNNSTHSGPGLRPITIMEGAWSWTRTDGDGIAGPYVVDPNTAGYTLMYNFYDFTHLAIFRNEIKESEYNYQIQASDSVSKQILILTDSAGNTVSYLWKIENKDPDQFLELTNPIPCCDNSFTMYFKRISNAQYIGE